MNLAQMSNFYFVSFWWRGEVENKMQKTSVAQVHADAKQY